ncbi:Xenotropic and polytropic retrovirus receptor 1 [Mucor circinelloides]
MKFAKYLESQSVPEWRKAYISYKGLKKKLKQVERFRKHKERKAAIQLDNVFQELEDSNDSYYWPHSNLSINMRPQSIMSRLSSRFSSRHDDDRPSSRQASFPSSTTTLSVLDQVLFHASASERHFFDSLDLELDKISRFYDEKEKESRLKLDALKVQMQFIAEYGRHLVNIGASHQEASLPPPEMIGHHRLYNWFKYQDPHTQSYTLSDLSPNFDYIGNQRISYNVARNRLKKAVTEYYRSLEFLRSYKTLNETGFQKILKKFDKIAGWKASDLYTQTIKKHHWASTSDLDFIIKETENLYINEFADGHRRRGMRKLRAPEKNEEHNSTILRIGIFLGMAIPMLVQAFHLAIDPKTAKQLPNLQTNIQIYACFLLPILFCLGFSVNLIVWHRSRINYKFIFELDPRHNLDYHQFAELPVIMLLISSFVIYTDFSQWFSPIIPSELCPLILFVMLIAIMLCPFDILYCSARKWLGVAIGRILLSYCFPVEFRDFFIADELNSLSYSIWTSSYFFCAYAWHWTDLGGNCNMSQLWVAPFLASLPPWWRLLQCFRRYRDSNEKVHLLNAAKYSSSIMAAIVTGLRRMYPSTSMTIFWIMTCLFNSMYTSTWDIKMDWGLLRPNSKNFLLRDELVFYRWTYYAAVPVNILLRFSWTLSIVKLRMNGQLLGILVALLEAYRRIQWNFFRLENEHLNNCGQYRAIKEIPLPFPLSDTDIKTEGLYSDEEERISILSNKLTKQESHHNSFVPAIMIPVSRHPSARQSIGPTESVHRGSFYGRRDFENKHDDTSDIAVGSVNNSKLCRKPSTLDNVLTRIKSMKNSDQSDESEAEFYDDYDDDDDDDDFEDY